MENPVKVQAKLAELNRGKPSKPWLAVFGFNSMPQVFFNQTGNPNFQSNSGYSVKLFVNRETGEIKAYAAQFFQG